MEPDKPLIVPPVEAPRIQNLSEEEKRKEQELAGNLYELAFGWTKDKDREKLNAFYNFGHRVHVKTSDPWVIEDPPNQSKSGEAVIKVFPKGRVDTVISTKGDSDPAAYETLSTEGMYIAFITHNPDGTYSVTCQQNFKPDSEDSCPLSEFTEVLALGIVDSIQDVRKEYEKVRELLESVDTVSNSAIVDSTAQVIPVPASSTEQKSRPASPSNVTASNAA